MGWLVALFVLALLLGVWSGRGVRDLAAFALSRAHFSQWAMVATIVATGVGGGLAIGMIESGYSTGIGVAVALLGFPLQLVWMGLLAPRFARFGAPLTLGEIFGAAYGEAARLLVSFLWIIFCAGVVGAQLAAIGLLLTSFLPCTLPVCAGIGALLVLLYCTVGGIRSIVATDILFLLIMVAVLPLLALICLFRGGINVPASQLSLFSHLSPLQFFSLFFAFLVGDMFIPPMVQRSVMAPTVAQARCSFLRAALLVLPFCFTGAIMGLSAYSIDPSLSGHEALPFLISALLPEGVRLLALAALLAAILTSANSYLHTASLAVARDLLGREGEWALLWVRLSTVAICGVALILAAQERTALHLLLTSFSLWGATMVVPLLLLLYRRPLPRWAFFSSVAIGLALLLFWRGWFGIGGILPAIAVTALFSGLVLLFELRSKSWKDLSSNRMSPPRKSVSLSGTASRRPSYASSHPGEGSNF